MYHNMQIYMAVCIFRRLVPDLVPNAGARTRLTGLCWQQGCAQDCAQGSTHKDAQGTHKGTHKVYPNLVQEAGRAQG